MEATGIGWILAIIRLLGAPHCSWAWTPARSQYSLANGYLNAAQRPLWILEDELMKRERLDTAESGFGAGTQPTTLRRPRTRPEPAPIHVVVRSESPRAVPPPAPTQRRFVLPRHLQLPSHYVHAQSHQVPLKPKTAQRRRQPQSLPIFDSAPGDNALPTASYPVFVYNGTRGELLVNTMLSAQRYPMLEPVPGQVLYPPSTPMFRPKPIVERFRVPGRRELLNLTLIPFYAHEAITAAPPVITTTSNTAPPPLTLTTPLPLAYETQLPRIQRQRSPKKTKQYTAYRSPQEVVQWRPATHLRSSPVLAAPDNHRHYMVASTTSPVSEIPVHEEINETQEDLQADLPDSSLEHKPTQESSTDSSSTSSQSTFQIVYLDESVEPPGDSTTTTTATAPPQQRHSSRYALKREYYAFPVYTLGKLLRDPNSQSPNRAQELEQLDSSECSSEQTDNTWIVLNSRYKGPHHNRSPNGPNGGEYYTSKYIQNPSSSMSSRMNQRAPEPN